MIDEKRLVTITYYKMNRENIKRKIKPVSLMFSEYYFYLIAYEADDEKYLPKFFRVDRIVAMTEHRELRPFWRQPAFCPETPHAPEIWSLCFLTGKKVLRNIWTATTACTAPGITHPPCNNRSPNG